MSATPPQIIATEKFEAIFQISHQAMNFSEERLLTVGCSTAELADLLQELGKAEAHVGTASGVHIVVGGGAETANGSGSETPRGEVTLRVDQKMSEWWPAVLHLVLTSLSPRELFLRTGFSMEELQSAAQELSP